MPSALGPSSVSDRLPLILMAGAFQMLVFFISAIWNYREKKNVAKHHNKQADRALIIVPVSNSNRISGGLSSGENNRRIQKTV